MFNHDDDVDHDDDEDDDEDGDDGDDGSDDDYTGCLSQVLLSQIPPRFTRPLQALDLFPSSHCHHDGNKGNDDYHDDHDGVHI